MDDDKVFLTWNDVENLTVKLARMIQAAGKDYDVYLGIARGGMFPALLLAQVFDRGLTLTSHLRRYKTDATDSEAMPRILSFPEPRDVLNRRVLLIDEVWHNGDSIIRAEQELLKFEPLFVDTAVLHFKPGKNRFPLRQPTFFVEKTEDWVVYPWEQFAEKVHRQDRP